MNEFNPSSRLGYAALKKETTEGTAVQPDVFFELLNDAPMLIEWGKSQVASVAGKIDKTMRQVKNNVPISGAIELYVEPKTVGYILQHFFGAPTSTTLAADLSYLHEYTMDNDPDAFTYELQKGDSGFVERYVGCRATKLAFSQEDNKIKIAIEMTARKAFSNARIKTEVNSGVVLTVDQTTGIVAGDTLYVLDKDDGHSILGTYTITSIDSETQITVVETIAVTLEVNDILVIKGQAPASSAYVMGSEMKFYGSAETKIGEDIDNTAALDFEDYGFEMTREGEAFFSASGCNVVDRMANDVKLKGFEAKGNFKKLYSTQEFLDQLREKENVAYRLKICGDAIDTNAIDQATANFGSGTGFSVTATAAGAFDGELGNDLNVVLVVNSSDVLAAAISGRTITVSLADTTAANNTGTLIAGVINALTGVDSAAISTGAQEFTVAATKVNLAGGRDANEKELLQIDHFIANYEPYNVQTTEDDNVTQDINFMASYDADNGATIKVSLRNNVASYT